MRIMLGRNPSELGRSNKLMSEKYKYKNETTKELHERSGEYAAPYVITENRHYLIIKGTFEQSELFGGISNWAVIELTAVDPEAGSSVSIHLHPSESQRLRQILEEKEIFAEEWDKKQGELIDKRKKEFKSG